MPIIGGGPGGNFVRSVSTVLAADATTTSSTFEDLVSVAITPEAGSTIRVFATINFAITGIVAAALVSFRIYSDTDGEYSGGSQTIAIAGQKGSVSINFQKAGVADDAQNISIQWKTVAGTAQCRPATAPNDEGACIIVDELKPS